MHVSHGRVLDHRSTRLILTLASLVVAIGLLLVQIRSAPESHPWGDTAITSINTARAARGDLAEGAYSRFHWNHPGPLLYQVLAPLYMLSGQREISIKWTVLLINIGALAGLLAIVTGRAPLLGILIGLSLVPFLYREQRLLFWAWNPIVPILPFALAIVLSAAISTGALPLLPLFYGAASFIVQSHVGFAPLVLTLIAASTSALLWRLSRARSTERAELVRWAAITAAVLLALWIVPIAHELRTYPGNLTHLVEFFWALPREPRRWEATFGIAANQLLGSFVPQWQVTTTAEAPAHASWLILGAAGVQFPLLLAAGIRALRRGASFEGGFALTLLMVSTIGLCAVAAIIGPASDYLLVWLPMLGALNLGVIASEALQLFRAAPRNLQRAARWFAVLYTLGSAVLGGTRLVGKHAVDARSPTVGVLTRVLDEYCRREGINRPILRSNGPAWQMAAGVVLQFYKTRRPIAVSDDMVFLVGDPFRATGREGAEFYVMMADETAFPGDVIRHEWLTTFGSYRLVRVYRD
jgi:hypothetical protein